MNPLAENLWLLRYPLTVLGTNHGRNVTVIRLQTGKLIIHSMAPFTREDVAEIKSLGEVEWLVESMLLHDTYAKEGRETFGADLPFLGPPGFGDVVGFPTGSLLPSPPEWGDEVVVMEIAGAPKLKEHAFLHVPSRTLILADLVFNFRPDETGWESFFHHWIAGIKQYPGMSRVFRWCVTDRKAFRTSIDALLALDFDRLIVGHGEVIESGARKALAKVAAEIRG